MRKKGEKIQLCKTIVNSNRFPVIYTLPIKLNHKMTLIARVVIHTRLRLVLFKKENSAQITAPYVHVQGTAHNRNA